MSEVFRRSARSRGRDRRRSLTKETAAGAVGEITKGCEIFGLSKGQFSLIDLIEHCLDATGPADVIISTWSAAAADIEYANRLITDGRIRSLRFLVDFSFPSRKPEYCDLLRSVFGDDCVRMAQTHAKFVVIKNDDWTLALRTSMNLNHNRRLESFEVSDDPGMVEYLEGVIDEVFAGDTLAAQLKRGRGQNETTLNAIGISESGWFGSGELDRDIRRAGWSTLKGERLK